MQNAEARITEERK